MLTQSQIIDLFEYRDGALYWRVDVSKRVRKGCRAGTLHPKGYVKIIYLRRSYWAHRLIYTMFNDIPPKYLDHINGVKDDNRIENLRAATASQNARNKKVRCDSKSKVKNVYWNPRVNKWQVRLELDKKRRYFGYFDDLELAALVASEARDKYHGEFARHG